MSIKKAINTVSNAADKLLDFMIIRRKKWKPASSWPGTNEWSPESIRPHSGRQIKVTLIN